MDRFRYFVMVEWCKGKNSGGEKKGDFGPITFFFPHLFFPYRVSGRVRSAFWPSTVVHMVGWKGLVHGRVQACA